MEQKPPALLRIGLLGNAAFSAATGILALTASKFLATYIGIPNPLVLVGLGICLLPFAASLVLTWRRRPLRAREVYLLSAMDAAWVVGSACILAFGLVPLTSAGTWVVALVALAVADFMVLQILGARRL